MTVKPPSEKQIDSQLALDAESKDATPNLRRRALLSTGVIVSISAASLPIKAYATLCQDPEELSSTDYSFRKYVEYTESWPNKEESCSKCASFRPGDGDCGRCQAVAGSINPSGHCTGWSQRK